MSDGEQFPEELSSRLRDFTRKGGFSTEENIVYQIRQKLGSNFTKFKQFEMGGTRLCFTALYGNRRRVIIKIDRKTLDSPRAQRHVERGYNGSKDASVLLGLRHESIPVLYQYESLGDYTVTVEEFIPGKTLEETVRDDGPLTANEAGIVFRGITSALDYVIRQEKILHRDPKPSNILISIDEKNRLEKGIITDFANAASLDEIIPKFMPTAGGHLVMDPRLMPWLVGSMASKYDEKAEVYAVGTSLFYAITGKYIFEFDPDNRTAIVRPDVKTRHAGESLINPKTGLIDVWKYEAALKGAVSKEMSLWQDGVYSYGKIIKSCLTLRNAFDVDRNTVLGALENIRRVITRPFDTEPSRYKTMAQLNKALQPVSKYVKGGIAALFIFAALFGLGRTQGCYHIAAGPDPTLQQEKSAPAEPGTTSHYNPR